MAQTPMVSASARLQRYAIGHRWCQRQHGCRDTLSLQGYTIDHRWCQRQHGCRETLSVTAGVSVSKYTLSGGFELRTSYAMIQGKN